MKILEPDKFSKEETPIQSSMIKKRNPKILQAFRLTNENLKRLSDAKETLSTTKKRIIYKTWILEELIRNYLPLLIKDAEKQQEKIEAEQEQIRQDIKKLAEGYDPTDIERLVAEVLEVRNMV